MYSHVLSDYLMTRDPSSWLVTLGQGRCEIAAFLLSMNELTGAVNVARRAPLRCTVQGRRKLLQSGWARPKIILLVVKVGGQISFSIRVK